MTNHERWRKDAQQLEQDARASQELPVKQVFISSATNLRLRILTEPELPEQEEPAG